MMTPKMNKIVESVKKGFADIKMVVDEGNYKLFVKQAVAIVVVFLGYHYLSGALQEQSSHIHGQIDAVKAQQVNEQAYLSNKKKLLDLEPRFPDLEAKNDWLLRQIVAVFKDVKLSPQLGASQAEDTSNASYTVAAIPVTLVASYKDLGRLLSEIENREEYLKVSEVLLTKNTESLGDNSISLRINTIFPKEKIAKTMFKDAPKAGGKK